MAQLDPVKPSKHVHKKFPLNSEHIAPFKHGDELQGDDAADSVYFINEIRKKIINSVNLIIFNKIK